MMSYAVKLKGVEFIHRLLPPVIVGSVIMVIGLGLEPVAVTWHWEKQVMLVRY